MRALGPTEVVHGSYHRVAGATLSLIDRFDAHNRQCQIAAERLAQLFVDRQMPEEVAADLLESRHYLVGAGGLRDQAWRAC